MSNIKSSIMIVEDESYIKKVLETALAAGGYRTISAVTGAQARSAISLSLIHISEPTRPY